MLMALLGACGSDDGEQTSTPTTSSDASDDGGSSGSESIEELIAAAEEEGEVTLYLEAQDATGEALVEAFTKKYPNIEMTYLKEVGGRLISRLDTEREQELSGGDVAVMSTTQWFIERSEAGDLMSLDGLPNAEQWAEVTGDDLSPNHLSVLVAPFAIAWNTDLVDEPLTGFEDLLREELKGRVGSIDLVAPVVAQHFHHIADVLGGDGMEQLAAQGPWRLFDSSGAVAQALISGEIAATAYVSPPAVVEAKEAGAPVDLLIPDNGTGVGLQAAALENAAHPNAARLLMDFLMSPEGQAAMVLSDAGASPLGPEFVPESPDVSNLTVLQPHTVSNEEWEELRVTIREQLTAGS